MKPSSSSKRLFSNTLVTYIQLLITTVINLVVIRYVLMALGQEEYGIYVLVAGVVSMLNVFSTSLSHASMRFMGTEMGKGDLKRTILVYNTSRRIHNILGFIILILLEVLGWIMFSYFLNIPSDKIFEAKIVYQCMVFTTFFSIITVPYDAIINAHENLKLFALLQILDSVLRLLLALYLLTFTGSRLILYGVGIMFIQFIARLIRQIYTQKNYQECRVNRSSGSDKSLVKSMFSFTGYEMLASFAALCQVQLRTLLINHFFGVRVNAGEGIGSKVNSQVNMVSVGITRAITPQMNKNEGGGFRERVIRLSEIGTKYTTFMYALVAMPLLLETQYILKLWLKEIPDYAVIFCQLLFIMQLADKFTWQIGNALKAVGQIKELNVVLSLLSIVGVIMAFFFFSVGFGPASIYLTELFVISVIGIYRLYLGCKYVNIDVLHYVKRVIAPVLVSVLISLLATWYVKGQMEASLFRLMTVSLVYITIFSSLFACIALSKNERLNLIKVLKSFVKHE